MIPAPQNLCYDCALTRLPPEDLEKWLRTKKFATDKACDRCSVIKLTCNVRLKARYLMAVADVDAHMKNCERELAALSLPNDQGDSR